MGNNARNEESRSVPGAPPSLLVRSSRLRSATASSSIVPGEGRGGGGQGDALLTQLSRDLGVTAALLPAELPPAPSAHSSPEECAPQAMPSAHTSVQDGSTAFAACVASRCWMACGGGE